MKHTDISSLFASPQLFCGTELTVAGWIRTVRDSKRFGFAEVNDGSCFKNLQLVLERDALDNYDEIVHAGVGSAVCATGILTATPQAQQPFELSVSRIAVTGPCAPDYPLQKSGTALSSCARCRTCASEPTAFQPHIECALWPPLPSTVFFRNADSSICTPRSSRQATARARAKCFR